uniref:Uncharacterized protein n=1 Tax=Fundulus heteroclitus TaxID=8078 RepID=A0A3Q2SYC8_FUNHE
RQTLRTFLTAACSLLFRSKVIPLASPEHMRRSRSLKDGDLGSIRELTEAGGGEVLGYVLGCSIGAFSIAMSRAPGTVCSLLVFSALKKKKMAAMTLRSERYDGERLFKGLK